MVARVNEDLTRIYSWSLENFLVLNPGKAQSILTSRRVSASEVDPFVLINEMVQFSDGLTLPNVVKHLEVSDERLGGILLYLVWPHQCDVVSVINQSPNLGRHVRRMTDNVIVIVFC
jgi:hypothetical protein